MCFIGLKNELFILNSDSIPYSFTGGYEGRNTLWPAVRGKDRGNPGWGVSQTIFNSVVFLVVRAVLMEV